MTEFDCVECGWHVVLMVPASNTRLKLCMQCVSLPGWHEDYELRRIFGGAPRGAAWPFDWPKPRNGVSSTS
jgi:hypothetical protein